MRLPSKPIGILLYGSDSLLLDTRRMVLESAGFCIVAIRTSVDAEAIIETQAIALVVLCHTLVRENCEAALKCANALKPIVKTFPLTTGGPTEFGEVPTATLSVFNGPQKLIETVGDLVPG